MPVLIRRSIVDWRSAMIGIRGVVLGLAWGVAGLAHAAEKDADAIFHGGAIITVHDGNPMAEAVAVKGGKILAVGSKVAVMAFKGNGTQMIDLGGKAMLPGFIDAHGHMVAVGLQRSVANLLPPPDGKGDSIAGIQSLLTEWANSDAAKRLGNGRVIMGFGYDDAQLKERRHPTRHDLDAVSRDKPVVIIHQSGHIGAINTKALEIARITALSDNPAGGLIRREAAGCRGLPGSVCRQGRSRSALAWS